MAFYVAPSEQFYYSVWRIIPTFDDLHSEAGGTCVLIREGQKDYLVTARHVIDPKYRPQSDGYRNAVCSELSLVGHVIRRNPDGRTGDIIPSHFSFRQLGWRFDPNDGDLAVLDFSRAANVVQMQLGPDAQLMPMSIESVADQDFLNDCRAGESIAFVGYPGGSPKYGDQHGFREDDQLEAAAPLLRQGVLAVPAKTGFRVDMMMGKDYSFIDAFAQRGFSGAPVIALQRGIKQLGVLNFSQYRDAKLIGLVCAHYRTAEDRADGAHAGLSYFIRSTSILSNLRTSDVEEATIG